MKKILLSLFVLGSSLMASDIVVNGTVDEYTHFEWVGGTQETSTSGTSVSNLTVSIGTKTGVEIENQLLETQPVAITTNHDKAISISTGVANLTDSANSSVPLVLKWLPAEGVYGTDDVIVTNGATTNTVNIYNGGVATDSHVGSLLIMGGDFGTTKLKAGSISGTTALTITVN